eukprot:scaffold59241_cov57-Phaeocystis_antarctica.AAC.4
MPDSTSESRPAATALAKAASNEADRRSRREAASPAWKSSSLTAAAVSTAADSVADATRNRRGGGLASTALAAAPVLAFFPIALASAKGAEEEEEAKGTEEPSDPLHTTSTLSLHGDEAQRRRVRRGGDGRSVSILSQQTAVQPARAARCRGSDFSSASREHLPCGRALRAGLGYIRDR